MNLHNMLGSIPMPQIAGNTRDSKFHVRSIPKTRGHYFGRDSSGYPCLLLATSDTTTCAPIKLAEIEVNFAVPCNVTLFDRRETNKTLTTIVCTSLNPAIQSYFAYVAETIVRIVGVRPTIQQVIESVRRLVDLFQHLERPSSKSVTGIFGELYAIHVSASPSAAVQAWRSSTDARFDFSVGDVRLEIKASGSRQREHNFSLEQCSPPPGAYGILVSLFIESCGGGLSVLELVQKIEKQLDGDSELTLKLQETVAESLGNTAGTALAMRFDEELARSSLRIYELADIPAIRDGVPLEVSQVRFKSDISHVPIADAQELAQLSTNARALLPSKNG